MKSFVIVKILLVDRLVNVMGMSSCENGKDCLVNRLINGLVKIR